jgi:hypothetical protein
METNFQRPFSISVGCCMIDDIFIGPVILGSHITGHNYINFLQNGFSEQLEDVPLVTRISVYFQQDQHDRAPSHYTQLVTQLLNDIFLNRWICHSTTINWPPRSPDLIPLLFYGVG